MLILLLSLNAFGAVLNLDVVHKKVIEEMPLLLEQEAKIRAAEGAIESQEGAFDHKLKIKTMNQVEKKYDNQFWEARLERQIPFAASRLYLGQRQGTGTFAAYDGKYETSSVGELFAGVDISLLRDRAMDEARFGRDRARVLRERERIEWTQKGLELMLKSSQTYWKWTVAGQKLRVLRDLVKRAEERQGFLEKKVKAGDTSEIKLIDNRRSLNKRRAELVKGEREYEIATQEMSLYLNRTPALSEVAEAITLSEDVTSSPLAETRDALPAFRLVALERSLLAQERELARSQMLPDLRVAVEGIRDVGRLPPAIGGQDQLRMGVMLEIPFENRKAEGKRTEVSGKLSALSYRQSWLEREWGARISQNRRALITTREQLGLQETEFQDTAKMARAELTRWSQGDSDMFFVNVREQDEAEAQIRLLETRALHEMMVVERRALDGQLVQLLPTPP